MPSRASSSPSRRPAAQKAKLRLEAYHEGRPDRHVLVTVSTAASLDELCDAVHERLGVRPEQLCLGETQARVTDAADLREGDVLRVVLPVLAAAGRASWRSSPRWADVKHHLLSLVLFVVLFQAFQLLVYQRLFRVPVEEDAPGIAPFDAPAEYRAPGEIHPPPGKPGDIESRV